MNRWQSSFREANGIDIHYTRTGGNKQPAVLLHGLMTSGISCWSGLAHVLEKEYDVIMPDARGHGRSGAPDSGYSYEDHADDIVGLIRALELVDPILMGHSMGGMTAAVVASRKPSMLRGLVLADPTFLTLEVQQEVYNSDVAHQHRQKLRMSLDELIEERRNKNSSRSDEIHALFAEARLRTSMAAFDVLKPPNPDYKKLMAEIDIPSLIVFGDKGVITVEGAEELKSLNSKLQTEQIKDAGHSVHLDQPDRFIKVVRSFMGLI